MPDAGQVSRLWLETGRRPGVSVPSFHCPLPCSPGTSYAQGLERAVLEHLPHHLAHANAATQEGIQQTLVTQPTASSGMVSRRLEQGCCG